MSVNLNVDLGQLKLKNPVMVASGTFGYGKEYAELIDVSKLGAIITKTITPRPRPGNPSPRIWEVGGGMLNSIGLANVGAEAFISEKLPDLRNIGTTVIVNVAGSSVEEYWEVVEILDPEKGFDGYEINISCPNVKDEGMAFGSNPHITERIVQGVRKRTERPIIPKLTPNVTSISDVARACEASGADAISLINTLVGLSVDIETHRSRLATVTGGYSGPPIKPVALAKVFEVHNAVSIPVIGIGGITNASDALEFIITGASAVQVGTANFVNPQATLEIIRGLAEYCEKHAIEEIRESGRYVTPKLISLRLLQILLLSLLLLELGCTSMPRYRRDKLPPSVKPGGRYVETGIASYYAHKFHGRPTASGEIFDMYGISAAHKTLPLGTVVKVKNLENGKTVTVTINDRGPFIKGRIIDLSYGAAKVVDMVEAGIARVRITVVEWGESK